MINAYLEKMKGLKRSENTVKTYNTVLQNLNKFKPLESITEKDLIAFFKQLNTTEQTFALYQTIIKKYFSDIGKKDIVAWIQKKNPKETLKSDDILTTDDINRLMDTTNSHYYKALIAFLYESGSRINEAKALKYKDFQETNEGMICNIPTTKTNAGYRKVILPFTSQYIRNLKTYLNASENDIVFNVGVWATNDMLKKMGKRAGITKPIHCHVFRHAQATTMVQLGYNEAIIRKKLGWSPTSGMIARYQHLNDNDVIEATLKNTGKLPHTAIKTEIKEAEKLSLVDASMQLSKINEENEALKSELNDLKSLVQGLIHSRDLFYGNKPTIEEAKQEAKEELKAAEIYDAMGLYNDDREMRRLDEEEGAEIAKIMIKKEKK
jgi:integrase